MPLHKVAVDPRKIRTGREGDTVIVLTSSLAGRQAKQRRNARAIRLSRPGHQALGYAADRCFMGRARRYPHMYTVIRLVSPVEVQGGRFVTLPGTTSRSGAPIDYRERPASLHTVIPAADEIGEAWSMLMTRVEYPAADEPDDGVRGEYFELAGEEYLQVETDKAGGVVLWSSGLTLSDVLTRVRGTLGAPLAEDDDAMIITEKGERLEGSSDALEQLAQKGPGRVLSLVSNYELGSFGWRRPQVKMEKGSVEWAECSLAGEHLDLGVLTKVVSELGSESVRVAMAETSVHLRQALGSVATG